MTIHSKNVVIVGAGVAGLAAGGLVSYAGQSDALAKHHPSIHVTILEARERTGGRVYTQRNNIDPSLPSNSRIPASCLNVPIDLGASWIHGVDDSNPLTQLAKEGQCEYVHTDSSVMFLEPGQSAESQEANDHIWTTVWDIFDEVQEYASIHRNSIPDRLSFKEWLTEYLEKKQSHTPEGSNYMSEQDKKLVPCLAMYWADENAIPLDNVSLKYMDAEDIFPGDHSIMTNGYDRVVKVISKNLNNTRVLLEHIVHRIEYDESSVRVLTDRGTFTADIVLVTVPLGVLKSDQITFSPPLPEGKQTSINRLGFGTMYKIVLYFPECFWPRDKHFLNFLPTETVVTSTPDPKLSGHLNHKQLEALRTYMQDLANYSSLVPLYDAPMLVGYATNRSAELMEQLSEEEAMEVYVCQLSHYYQELTQDPARYRPVRSFMTRWHTDPYTRGSYTSIPTGAHLSDIEQFQIPVGARSYSSLSSIDDSEQQQKLLQVSQLDDVESKRDDDDGQTTVLSFDDPQDGRVFFAGEHTSPSCFASVHGAIISGRLMAAKITDRNCHI
ncbi:hypothetical protein BG004_002159 [Podila humilis]|nr:hypothetical protein BG004_002159 [Podila humilis]